MSVTEQLLDEMATLVAGAGDSARVRGEGMLFVVGSLNTISYTPEGPRRITGVRMNGTNIVVSRSGVKFNDVNAAASGFLCHVIANRDNNNVEGYDQQAMNVVIIPPEQVWIDNGGAAKCFVTIFWDILDGAVFHN